MLMEAGGRCPSAAGQARLQVPKTRSRVALREAEMDTTTLVILIVIILVIGGGWYGRGRWF